MVLNGHDAIQDALVKHAADFAGRIPFYSDQHAWNTELIGSFDLYAKVAINSKFGENNVDLAA